MSSLSSRFSSLSSANPKAYHPPRPTYNSPKLVQDSTHAPTASPSQLPAHMSHPFATPSFVAPRRPPVEPRAYRDQPCTLAHAQPQPLPPHMSEFGAFHIDSVDAPLAASHTAPAHHSASHQPSHFEPLPLVRSRSRTLGSQTVTSPDLAPLDHFLPSPNPIKSQFDDSDDEEQLQIASKSLSGMPHRARLAALGTASRLFKGTRHSRTPSTSITPTSNSQQQPVSLRADKQRESNIFRPSTSDGMSPLPRKAVFGHRPSPSELSLSSRSERTNSLPAVDRDLILGLKGGALNRRSKPSEKKLLPQPNALPKPSTQHHQWSDAPTSSADPPPYCADDVHFTRGESLRKSHSLSTLPFDPARRPSMPLLVAQNSAQSASGHVAHASHAEPGAWEAVLAESPRSSDHSSVSSCGRVVRTELIPDLPPKRLAKTHRLPPQKPPPRSHLPPPPLPQTNSSPEHKCSISISENSSLDVDTASCDSTRISTATKSAREMEPVTMTLALGVAQNGADALGLLSTSGFSREESGQQQQDSAVSMVKSQAQVMLDVGGTKLVTLVSTLQGSAGDHPRILDGLLDQENVAENEWEAALCKESQLMRRKRVDVSHRPTRDVSSIGHSRQDSQPRIMGTVEEDSAAEQLTAELAAALSRALGTSVSQSIASLGTSASASGSGSGSVSVSVSQMDSDTSTRRTSDMSDTSDWTKCVREVDTSGGERGGIVIRSDVGGAEASLVHELVLPAASCNDGGLASSRLCSPWHSPCSPLSNPTPKPNHAAVASIFLDRNGDLFRDILDILRTHKLPYRLQAASVNSTWQPHTTCADDAECMLALRLKLRCRLHDVRDEAEWLGYYSIVRLCESETCVL